ncbi:fructosamine kinase family protein [Mesohalobacter halotolerans]|uniref:Fructosamine kinase family protein n=1 Tax=Mesohalobacter halotolerans TaxID=1883405 RepID=A0A4U5TSN5_9FLAO|nr:fructosamine kinase family protein [Mesohalobacter halotolerans]TKS57032.1 fructosamine kinase family protein [Mesohalobacter halotolerans]
MEHIKAICQSNAISDQNISPLSGGDINDTYKITTSQEAYVIKINQAKRFPKMFELEAKSLEMLAETNSFVIPEVIAHGDFEKYTYLILEFIDSDQPRNPAESFAVALAKLHQNKSDHFGLEFNNYIGRLAQYNLPQKATALEFHIDLRLEPQFKLAHQNGFEFEGLDNFYKNLETIIPEESASLIHGDLWAGNHLFTPTQACIFDPAIGFAPREMDLAMMKLFGGYSPEIFKIYNDIFPLESDWDSRTKLWQLYYILVHLNLFGSSYYGQAKQIISQYQ